MTILTGIYSYSQSETLDDRVRSELREAITRNNDDYVEEFKNKYCQICKVDIGAFNSRASYIDEDGLISILAGEPILRSSDQCSAGTTTRYSDLKTLHKSWSQLNWLLLEKVRGSFCAAHYNPINHTLHLISDKLGLRTLYFVDDGETVFFSTALRILESINSIKLKLDIRGVLEKTALGFPLSNRTPYLYTKCLEGGEVISFSKGSKFVHRYWQWDKVEPVSMPAAEIVQTIHKKFMESIKCRLNCDKVVQAFLSGGLDSRTIVTALLNCEAIIHTFNSSRKNTYDQLLSLEYALKLGTNHHSITISESHERELLIFDFKNSFKKNDWGIQKKPDRPLCVWAGDGGSGIAGLEHITETIVGNMRKGKIESAVSEYLSGRELSKRLLNISIGDIQSVLKIGLQEELTKHSCSDPGRIFYVFLLLNHQRRHLEHHYENIDMSQIELITPFYDADFIEFFISIPIEYCLYHKIYMDWLYQCLPIATTVAWQAYRGHVPCPIPLPKKGRDQWARDKALQRAMKRYWIGKADETLKESKTIGNILNLKLLRFAKLLTLLGIRDYSYVIKQATTLCKYINNTNGRCETRQSPN